MDEAGVNAFSKRGACACNSFVEMQIRAGWKQSGKVVVVVVDEGEGGVVVVVREVEEERKRKKKVPIRKEAEGVGGGRGQEGNYRPSRAAGRSFIGPDEEKKDWQAAGVDERTKTRRGTGPAPFSLFGHTQPGFPP
jgi:hypothetical protein